MTIGSSSSWLRCPFVAPLSARWLFFNTFTFSGLPVNHLFIFFCVISCRMQYFFLRLQQLAVHRVIITVNKIVGLRYTMVLQQNHWHAILNFSLKVQENVRGFPQVIRNSRDWPHLPLGSFNHLFILRVSSLFIPTDKCSSCHHSPYDVCG